MERGLRLSIKDNTPNNAMQVLDMFLNVWFQEDCISPVKFERMHDPNTLNTFYDVYFHSKQDLMYLKIKGIPYNLKDYIKLI